MKVLLFKNRETGESKTVGIDENISNITAARTFRETHGKQWGLVESRQPYRKPAKQRP